MGGVVFKTAKGSTFLLERNPDRLIRVPGCEGTRRPDDYDPIRVLGVEALRVGEPALIRIDAPHDPGAPVYRGTSPVVSIAEEPEDWPVLRASAYRQQVAQSVARGLDLLDAAGNAPPHRITEEDDRIVLDLGPYPEGWAPAALTGLFEPSLRRLAHWWRRHDQGDAVAYEFSCGQELETEPLDGRPAVWTSAAALTAADLGHRCATTDRAGRLVSGTLAGLQRRGDRVLMNLAGGETTQVPGFKRVLVAFEPEFLLALRQAARTALESMERDGAAPAVEVEETLGGAVVLFAFGPGDDAARLCEEHFAPLLANLELEVRASAGGSRAAYHLYEPGRAAVVAALPKVDWASPSLEAILEAASDYEMHPRRSTHLWLYRRNPLLHATPVDVLAEPGGLGRAVAALHGAFGMPPEDAPRSRA